MTFWLLRGTFGCNMLALGVSLGCIPPRLHELAEGAVPTAGFFVDYILTFVVLWLGGLPAGPYTPQGLLAYSKAILGIACSGCGLPHGIHVLTAALGEVFGAYGPSFFFFFFKNVCCYTCLTR